MFVVTTTIQCVIVIGWSFTLVVHRSIDRDENFWVAAGNEAACIVLFLYCFVFFFFVGGLTCFHIYLISRNRTTYENFKFKGPADGDDANGISCCESWYHFCCVEVPPSRLRLRAHIRFPERPLPTSTPLIRTTNGNYSPVVNVAGRKPSANTIKSTASTLQVPLPAPTMVLSPPVSGSASLRGRTRGPLPRKLDASDAAQATGSGKAEGRDEKTAYESCEETAGEHESTATSARRKASIDPGKQSPMPETSENEDDVRCAAKNANTDDAAPSEDHI